MKVFDCILRYLFRFWCLLVVVVVVVQGWLWWERNYKKDNVAEGLDSIRKYMAVQEFLQEVAPKKKGDVCYIGLEDGRVLKVRLIKTMDRGLYEEKRGE